MTIVTDMTERQPMILQLVHGNDESENVDFAAPKGSSSPCSVAGMGPPVVSRAVMEEAQLYGQIQKALGVLGEAFAQQHTDGAHCIPLEAARSSDDARTAPCVPESDEEQAAPRILPFPKRAI